MGILAYCVEALRGPGAKGPVEAAAPTQQVLTEIPSDDGKGVTTITTTAPRPALNVTGYSRLAKERRLDRWLDWLVQASGSEPVFLLISLSLLAWAFLGIPYGSSTDWAVIISDVQAIVSYLFDSLLMRQQLNGYDEILRVACCLRSRSISQRRMLREVLSRRVVDWSQLATLQGSHSAELPAESIVGRVSTLAAKYMGHIVSVFLYWVGIFIWIGFGSYMDWSDQWQLYINSATSALMVLIFAFLANIRERHSAYAAKCLNHIFEVDSTIEFKLRTMTGNIDPNPSVTIPAPKVGRLQRAIFYYADVVGTLVGIAILIVVMVVWIAIGPLMQFNSNWWLLIGTYAGLVGLNDGFVLRNVQARLNEYEDAAFAEVAMEDMNVLLDAGIPDPKEEHIPKTSITHRASVKMGIICAHEVTVVLGVILIFGLIAGASAMKWTTTGQLLCNVPPSLIESFFMLILITFHNISDSRRRLELHDMYVRRLRLLDCVTLLEAPAVKC